MKNIFLCLTLLIVEFLIPSQIMAYPSLIERTSEKLLPLINKILKLPELKALIAQIEKEGSISIYPKNHPLSSQFGAFWDMENRSICVNARGVTEGEMLGSLVFELHNAASDSQFRKVDQLASLGKINRENYIRKIEYIEYENSLKASRAIQDGIRLGIFPENAFLPTYKSFEEHYKFQKIGGHTQWIGKNYDLLRAN